MRVFVEDSNVVLAQQRRDGAQIRLIAGREYQRRFFADEFRQPPVGFQMKFQRAIEKARTGYTGAITPRRFDCRIADARVCCEAQVIVRPQHHNIFVFESGGGSLGIAQRAEKGIDAHLHRFFGDSEFG